MVERSCWRPRKRPGRALTRAWSPATRPCRGVVVGRPFDRCAHADARTVVAAIGQRRQSEHPTRPWEAVRCAERLDVAAVLNTHPSALPDEVVLRGEGLLGWVSATDSADHSTYADPRVGDVVREVIAVVAPAVLSPNRWRLCRWRAQEGCEVALAAQC